MKAGVLQGADVVLTELPEPVPGPTDLVLEVRAAGICGSDLSAGRSGVPDGTVLGHEICGEVVAAGPEVRGDWAVGTLVTAIPAIGCGRCSACLTGSPTSCRTGEKLGLGAPGGFAERVRVGARESLRVPEGIPAERAVLTEPLAVGLHTVQSAGLTWGDHVLVVGAGPVGLAAAIWARHLGAASVTVSDPVGPRRALALACGADIVIDPVAEPLDATYRALRLPRATVAVDCAGGRVGDALGVLAQGGRIAVAAYSSAPVEVPAQRALLREARIVFSSWYTRAEWDYTLGALTEHRLLVDALVTHVVSLDDLPETYRRLKTPTDEGKVLLRP